MTDPDTDNKSNNGAENEKPALDESVSVPIDDMDESKAQLINANGGAGEHPEVAIVDRTDKSSDRVSFNGLGKDEVMQYANDPFWVRLRWVLFILFWIGWFTMLVTAIVIIVVAPRCPPRPNMKWYQTDTVYQAYSKSFKDSDQDGVGDFQGLKDKFDYITDDLGVNAVYLNAIFKTDETHPKPEERDLAIVDHKDLDSKFGATVSTFRSWIKDLRKKGQKVIVDLIPNHTSKKHEWFVKSKAGDKEYKDYYIWAGSSGNVPNNWTDKNGDSAWEFDADRGQYYYHSYSKDLPDLNLNNEAVKQEIKDIMKFWFGAGVGGFNIQGLEYLLENPDVNANDDGMRTQTRNYEGSLPFLKELRSVANSYSDKPGRERFLFGNVMFASYNQTLSYWGDDDEKILHLVISPMEIDTSCDAFCLSKWIGTLPDDRKQWLGLQLGNQDTSRIASRGTTASSPKDFIKIAQAIQMLLPGTPFNYYGDEFGQKNGNESQLPNNIFNPLNARTPMQWSNDDNAGFTDAGTTPWLALGPDYKTNNLRASRSHFNDDSILQVLQRLIKLREKESFQWGKTKACAVNSDVLLFTRKAERFPYLLTLVNVGDTADSPHLPSVKCVDSKEKGTVVFHSSDEDKEGQMLEFDVGIKLQPGDIVVIEFAADD